MSIKRFLCSFIFAAFIFTQTGLSSENMTLEEISKLVQKSDSYAPVTGKIELRERTIDHLSPTELKRIPGKDNMFVFGKKNPIFSKTILFDNKQASTRIDEVDLAEGQNVSPNDPADSDISNTQIFKGRALLNYSPSLKTIILDQNKEETQGRYNLKHYRYGYVKDSWLALDGAEKVEISNVAEGEKNMITVHSERRDEGKLHVRIITIDPTVGYRCLSMTEYYDGKRSREIKYENYKNFDGYYLPERYCNKLYKNGFVVKEIEINIRNAQFGIKVKDDVFSVEVPKGTRIISASPLSPDEGLKSWVTEKDEKLIIDLIAQHEENVSKPLSLLGKPLPDLKAVGIAPPPAKMQGKIILVCFFDMEQRPSRNCITQLAKQAEQLKQKGMIAAAIQASKVDENSLREWIKTNNIPFPVGMIQGDEEKNRFAWGVKALPWLILTDKNHVVSVEGFAVSELQQHIRE